jgi:hypothetical protein
LRADTGSDDDSHGDRKLFVHQRSIAAPARVNESRTQAMSRMFAITDLRALPWSGGIGIGQVRSMPRSLEKKLPCGTS